MTRPLLIIPGWQNSKPAHWQSLWEAARPEARRVQMPDWELPELEGWVAALDAALAACETPPVVACHSLGCIALVHAVQRRSHPIHAALLVAPADVDRPACPPELRGFSPIPRAPLPFRSHVIATADDPYLDPERARALAQAWGARFTLKPDGGHLNATAGYGPWPEGEAWLAELAAF